MDIEGLYQGLRRIQARGEIGNAYGGCGTVEEESNVLVDFFECIMEKYKDSMPLWAEAFIQIFDWQFQMTMKEVDVKLDGQVVQLKIRRAFHSRNPLTSRYYVNLMEAGHERGIRLCCRGREDAEMLTKKIREGKITDLTGYPAEWNQ